MMLTITFAQQTIDTLANQVDVLMLSAGTVRRKDILLTSVLNQRIRRKEKLIRKKIRAEAT